MKILFFLLLSIFLVNASLYTSSHMKKQGFKIDGKYDSFNPILQLGTTCTNVDLSGAPYFHNGIVRSGYMSVGKGNSVLGFIFYGKQNASIDQIKKTPTLIWMNGGPGSSSQLGNFLELGPLWIVSDDTPLGYHFIKNNNSWVKQWNVIFIDQPVGTGLAYADPKASDPYTHSMDDVAQDFYNGLKQLYTSPNGCFNQLGISPGSDLYVFGQSYAGKYVPAISAKILQQKQTGGFLTGLRGMGIGDPFTQPYDILAQVGGFASNLGLLDYQQRSKIQVMMLNATIQQRNKQWNDLHDSFDNILDAIVEWAGNVNVYDIRSYRDYDTSTVGTYLNNPTTKALFGFSDEVKFGSQGGNVYEGLYQDFMKPYIDRVEYCLSRNLPSLIYNGQDDLIVQTPGTMRWVGKINYKDANTLKNTIFKTWKIDGVVAGSIKSAGYLQVRIVFNAGHLVPMDQGKNSLQMIKSFINRYKVQQKYVDQ